MILSKSGWVGSDLVESDVRKIQKGIYLLVGSDNKIYYVGSFGPRKSSHRLCSKTKTSESHNHHLLYFLFPQTFFKKETQKVHLSWDRDKENDLFQIVQKMRKSNLFKALNDINFSLFLISLDDDAIKDKNFRQFNEKCWENSLLFHIFLQHGSYPLFNSMVPSLKTLLYKKISDYDKQFESDKLIFVEVMKLIRRPTGNKMVA